MSEQPDGTNWTAEPQEVSKRSDLRQTHLVFSIDPEGCEDVDDTLSVRFVKQVIETSNSSTVIIYRTLKNGDTELGVHIADVSYFVKPGSHTDREARER